MRKTRSLLVGIVSFFSFIAASAASELMRPASALEAGKWGASVYRTHVEHDDLEFRLGSGSPITVPLQGGGTASFFGAANTDLRFDGEGDATILRLTWRPADGLHYGIRFGLGDYELRVPSGSVVNKLTNSGQGRTWGLDLGWTIVGNSPVTPAVMLSGGYSRSDYGFRRLDGATGPVPVDQKFSIDETQAALSLSYRWKFVEPYAGARFFRQTSTLRDLPTAERVRGSRDGFAGFAGARVEFRPRESFVIEAAGGDEAALSAGLAIGF